jgi:hypothetical protein
MTPNDNPFQWDEEKQYIFLEDHSVGRSSVAFFTHLFDFLGLNDDDTNFWWGILQFWSLEEYGAGGKWLNKTTEEMNLEDMFSFSINNAGDTTQGTFNQEGGVDSYGDHTSDIPLDSDKLNFNPNALPIWEH